MLEVEPCRSEWPYGRNVHECAVGIFKTERDRATATIKHEQKVKGCPSLYNFQWSAVSRSHRKGPKCLVLKLLLAEAVLFRIHRATDLIS